MIKTFETIINEFEPQNAYQLLLGYDEQGHIHSHDLLQHGHILMSGTTGSGKSVIMKEMVLSLMMHHTPETLEVSFYDAKWVEFSDFIQSSFIHHHSTEYEDVAPYINQLFDIFKYRKTLFSKHQCKNIQQYNDYAQNNHLERLPMHVVFIDEYTDFYIALKNNNNNKTMNRLRGLLQQSRAYGIYFVIATQSPRENVIGDIKNDIPSRIGMALNNEVESIVAIDEPGAEKLPYHGAMLYRTSPSQAFQRIQSSFVSYVELDEIINSLNRSH